MCLLLCRTLFHATSFSRALLSVGTMPLEGISSLSQWDSGISQFKIGGSGLPTVRFFFFLFLSFLFYSLHCGDKYIKEDFTYFFFFKFYLFEGENMHT